MATIVSTRTITDVEIVHMKHHKFIMNVVEKVMSGGKVRFIAEGKKKWHLMEIRQSQEELGRFDVHVGENLNYSYKLSDVCHAIEECLHKSHIHSLSGEFDCSEVEGIELIKDCKTDEEAADVWNARH